MRPASLGCLLYLLSSSLYLHLSRYATSLPNVENVLHYIYIIFIIYLYIYLYKRSRWIPFVRSSIFRRRESYTTLKSTMYALSFRLITRDDNRDHNWSSVSIIFLEVSGKMFTVLFSLNACQESRKILINCYKKKR